LGNSYESFPKMLKLLKNFHFSPIFSLQNSWSIGKDCYSIFVIKDGNLVLSINEIAVELKKLNRTLIKLYKLQRKFSQFSSISFVHFSKCNSCQSVDYYHQQEHHYSMEFSLRQNLQSIIVNNTFANTTTGFFTEN
jgi:hypothetical protein